MLPVERRQFILDELHKNKAVAVNELAQQLGVKKIVMMSGLPTGCAGDKTPVWITTSWPPETQDILDYQWNQVAIPAWKKLVKLAEDCGIERIALENQIGRASCRERVCLYV